MRKLRKAGLVIVLLLLGLVSLRLIAHMRDAHEQALWAARAPGGMPVEVSVDPRVELVSIIFRLAGNPEYNEGLSDSYARAVEKHFGPYRNHPAITYAANLRQTRGICYDAPMTLAVHLTEGFGFQELVPFSPLPPDLDSRWDAKTAREFLAKARQFATDTHFQDFFKSQKPLYRQAEARMKEIMRAGGHLKWFDSFFGTKPNVEFHVVVALLNGRHNYGPDYRAGDTEHMYALVGGDPSFGLKERLPAVLGLLPADPEDMLVQTIAHEFCHSYVNPIVERHLPELRPAGERLFSSRKDKMARQAYGSWETMMREAMVRACVVRYCAETRGPRAAESRSNYEAYLGFTWTRDLANLLTSYEANRQAYPNLDAFFPKIVEFFDTVR